MSLAVFIPFVLFAWQTLPLDSWIIDDAGISFAYARNLAQGHGLVSQPGMPPVEGYSNPLWVFLLTPFFLLGIFDPVITPKLFSLLLVFLGFVSIGRFFQQVSKMPELTTATVLALIATNTSLVIWMSSGLENALYFALGMCLLMLCTMIIHGDATFRLHLMTGAVVAGLALTRPEGIVYAILYLFAGIVASIYHRLLSALGKLLAGLIVTALIVGGHQVFRLLYFGDWLPNPAHVKGTPGLIELIGVLTFQEAYLLKYRGLCASVIGDNYWLVPDILLLGAGIAIAVLVIQKRLPIRLLLPFLMVLIAAGLYLLLSPDWMREFRLATLYFPAVMIALVVAFELVIYLIRLLPIRWLIGAALLLLLIWQSHNEHRPRLLAFAGNPTVPMSLVKEIYVDRYAAVVAYLKLDSVSQLLPDLGGTLYYSSFVTYDFAGLTDRSIAKHRGTDHLAFYIYVFDTIKPTIIHTHGFFSSVSRLEKDPRFRRDYVAIRDSLEGYWNDSVLAGDYLRREAIIGKDSLLAILQRGERPWLTVTNE